MQIITENLTYNYGGKTKSLQVKALDGVSLTINEGEFFGIIGQTGSGKSTFACHLNGLIKIQKNGGSVRVGEFSLGDKKCDMKKLRSKVGMVFQYPEYQLFAETVKEDVAFGLKNFFPDISESIHPSIPPRERRSLRLWRNRCCLLQRRQPITRE